MDEYFRVTDGRTRLQSLWQSALVVVLAFVAGLALALIGISGLAEFGYTRESDFVVWTVVSTALQFLGFLAVVYWYFATVEDFERLVHVEAPGPRDLGWTIVGLVALVAVNVLLAVLFARLGVQAAGSQIVAEGREAPVLFLYLVPVTILLVAPAEELVFRGVVQGQLRRAYGVVPGVVLASAIFGVVHYAALGGTGSRYATIAVIATLGLLLGAIYELSENVLVSTAVHASWNVAVFLWNYADVTGLV